MLNSTGNSRGTFQDMGGQWLTKELFPLRLINLEYLGPSDENPERAIRAVYNDGMVLTAVVSGIEALMEHENMAPYQDTFGNLLANEREHWFANKNPYLTSKLLLE